MTWSETWHLVSELLTDPSSHAAAATAGWAHPLSHESIVARDLFDLTAAANSGKRKPKPYPRPWDPQATRVGRATLPQAEIRAILAARGPQPTIRDRNGRLHGERGRFIPG